jgi:mycoredoxin
MPVDLPLGGFWSSFSPERRSACGYDRLCLVRTRCPVHGLALGDDGSCVVCRRPSLAPPAAERSREGGSGPAALLVGAAVALTGLVGVVFLLREPRSDFPAIGPEKRAQATPARELPGLLDVPGGSRPPARAPAGPVARDRATPPVDDDAAMAATRARASREAALAKQQAAYEDWAHREAMNQIAEDEARARSVNGGPRAPGAGTRTYGSDSRVTPGAQRRVSITMYSTSWCGVCRRARAYMDSAQIPYVERNVEQDPGAAAEAHRLNPRGSVPTFDVGGTPLIGFDATNLNAAIDRARARL